MSLTFHSVVVAGYARNLRHMLVWLERAQAHADAVKFDSANYLSMRLAPDMLPFSAQVMIACEVAKLGPAKLLGMVAPALDQKDTCLADLRTRLLQALNWLDGVAPAQFGEGVAARIAVERRGLPALDLSAEEFVQTWSQPNFQFHVTMTYALLRHAGVQLGKADYLGIY